MYMQNWGDCLIESTISSFEFHANATFVNSSVCVCVNAILITLLNHARIRTNDTFNIQSSHDGNTGSFQFHLLLGIYYAFWAHAFVYFERKKAAFIWKLQQLKMRVGWRDMTRESKIESDFMAFFLRRQRKEYLQISWVGK